MQIKYEDAYREVLNAPQGEISSAIRRVIKKYKIKIEEHNFRTMFYRWRKSNLKKVTPPVTKEAKSGHFTGLLESLSPNANPLGLPTSLEQEQKPFKLPVSHNDILLINDIHIPYHNIAALTAALKYGMDNEVNTVIINGDLIDFYAISRFDKDPRKRNLANEINMTREFLATLRKLFPSQNIYFKLGNHDVRWEHYIMNKAPDLLGLGEFDLSSVLHLADHNIFCIPDKQIIHAGKLTILHGHELGKSVFSPVNVARGLYMRAKDNAICGHNHQVSHHTEPNINGKVVACWSVGCLSELHPDYAPYNKYSHGFAHIRVFEDESFEVQNFSVINGKVR